MKRREFLRSLSLFPLAALLGSVGRNLFGADADADVAKKMAKTTDPLPSALKYVEDAKKCSTCIQYAKKTTLKGEEVGTCTLFNGGYVKGAGWCMSWSKKG
jgi:hypothetical protein